MTTTEMKAKKPDKFVLYMKSVQDAIAEVDFLTRVYRQMRKKEPRVLREDFCGTAAVTCEWVQRGRDRRAYGIDLDKPTLQWGEKRHVSALGDMSSRVKLINGDVLDKHGFKADVVAALNFSYFIFKERQIMLQYAKGIRSSLAKDGLFVLDIFGGPDAQIEESEETDHGHFIYVWDQASYNPVNGHIKCHIHFKLPDGSMMRKAFTYDWRLWTLPEMTDLLKEAGFRSVDVYWEGTDPETGAGNGVYRHSQKGDDSVSWIAYIVAAK
ncbi:MAG: class I SAM-dependent methyltransferase [Planctomycetota bacterium]